MREFCCRLIVNVHRKSTGLTLDALNSSGIHFACQEGANGLCISLEPGSIQANGLDALLNGALSAGAVVLLHRKKTNVTANQND